ncbi:amidohydrolase family protein [Georgenia thermotolerans]|uniref:Amidohydrolase family protein n=1 Tax=Georgenia thermotolerans TaxID=527326 RepID=A0A7J5USC9_9MICO|nr:amidohydrolase family protein [Georgenia thermotolerans]KAE8765289.1 amidohydrolase family protein [Georgenia thermotolerans]
MEPLIDTHVHVWDLTGGPYGVTYPWLTPDFGALHATHTLDQVLPDMAGLGVTGMVLVQASDSLAETDELLRVAATSPLPTAVVGWLPLADAAAAERELARRPDPRLVGARHLIHDEPDPRWMLEPPVAVGMAMLERHGLVFDAVAERPDLLTQVPQVARRHPRLTIVVDHLGKPPVTAPWRSEAADEWRRNVADAAGWPNIYGKVSGLGTISRGPWHVSQWRPYLEHALEAVGAERLMLGSDWPVCTQNGDYPSVMGALLELLEELSPAERQAIRAGTAARVYGVGDGAARSP